MVCKLILKLFNFYPTGGPQVSCQNGFGAID